MFYLVEILDELNHGEAPVAFAMVDEPGRYRDTYRAACAKCAELFNGYIARGGAPTGSIVTRVYR